MTIALPIRRLQSPNRQSMGTLPALLPVRRKMESPRTVGRHRHPEPGCGLHAGADQRLEPGILRRAAKQAGGCILDAAGALHLSGVWLHHHWRFTSFT